MASFPKGENSGRDNLLQMHDIKSNTNKVVRGSNIYQECDQQYRTTRKSNISRDTHKQQQKQKISINQSSLFIFNKIGDGPEWIEGGNTKGDINFDPLDLTFTLIISQINMILVASVFFMLVTLRYYTLGCLIYVVIQDPAQWQWILVLVIIRIMYFILVLRVSLTTAQTKTQIILKTHWNSKDADVHELFQVTDTRKLLISICRAFIPPQLSFVYIKTKSQKKRFQIYTAINYIYLSMEMIIYYPFFIIYCIIINPDKGYALNVINPNFTVFLALAGELIVISLSVYLLLVGIHKRFGTILCCCK